MTISVALSSNWIEYLTRQPESGMGYQLVDIVLEDGTMLERCPVFNAERLELPERYAHGKIKKMKLRRTDTSE